jgi:hypothetical protein
MRNQLLLGLPRLSLNLLSGGFFVFIVCLGVRVAKAPELALRVANTQLITGSSANKLDELASKLDTQADVIRQKDQSYAELKQIYEQSLKGQEGYGRLQKTIEGLNELPQVENIENIQSEINTTKEILEEAANK